MKKNRLDVGFLCERQGKNVNEHLETFSENIQAAATNMMQRPLYINCHSRKNYFSEEDGVKFIDTAAHVSNQTGIPVYHETYRGRLMYSGPITKIYLQKRPELLLNADLSHWCNVHESFLGDQQETLDLVLARACHIHARIGHPEGPQVNDSRAPEWKRAVYKHFEWWDKTIEHKLNCWENSITILTEFGPPDYLQVLPANFFGKRINKSVRFVMLQNLKAYLFFTGSLKNSRNASLKHTG